MEERCTFETADLNDFCAGADPFDAVIAIGLFDYISPSKQREVLDLLFSVARGDVVVAFPKKWVPGALVRKIWFMKKRLDIYYFTRGGIRKLLKDSGRRAEFVNCGPLWCVRFSTDQKVNV